MNSYGNFVRNLCETTIPMSFRRYSSKKFFVQSHLNLSNFHFSISFFFGFLWFLFGFFFSCVCFLPPCGFLTRVFYLRHFFCCVFFLPSCGFLTRVFYLRHFFRLIILNTLYFLFLFHVHVLGVFFHVMAHFLASILLVFSLPSFFLVVLCICVFSFRMWIFESRLYFASFFPSILNASFSFLVGLWMSLFFLLSCWYSTRVFAFVTFDIRP